MSPKREPILKRFNKTDRRIFSICAFLWRFHRQNKLKGKMYLNIALRLNLMGFDAITGYFLTDLGKALVERHEARFKKLYTDYVAASERMAANKRKTASEGVGDALP